jgi:hypothetical protein
VNVAAAETQDVIGASVGRKPILPVDLFAVGDELGSQILAAFLVHIGNVSPACLDDLKVAIVYPNAALEVTLTAFLLDMLGSDVKHVVSSSSTVCCPA